MRCCLRKTLSFCVLNCGLCCIVQRYLNSDSFFVPHPEGNIFKIYLRESEGWCLFYFSLNITWKSHGPSLDPCGTPPGNWSTLRGSLRVPALMIPGSLDSAFLLRLVLGEALNRRRTFWSMDLLWITVFFWYFFEGARVDVIPNVKREFILLIKLQ